MMSLRPKYLKRYKDITGLLVKYGFSDVLRQAKVDPSLETGGSVPPLAQVAGPEQLADDFERLGPTYVKLGQLLSTRPDILPEAYLKALTRLQDDVAPISWEEVEHTISEELGVSPQRAFAEINTQPLAAASLGQVHRGRLRDGREVVIKVQRPGIRGQVADDLAALNEIAQVIDAHTEAGRRYQFSRIVRSLRNSLLNELDYRREAENCRVIRDNLRQFPRIVLPEPILDFTTSRVLTMTYLSGVKITDVSPAVLIELNRESLADELMHAYLHQILVDGIFHADPHPGNVNLLHDKRIALIDLGMIARTGGPEQEQLVKLLMATSEGRGGDAASIALDMAEKLTPCDAGRFRQEVANIVGEHYKSQVRNIQAGAVILQIQRVAAECGIIMPEIFTMIGKTLLNLDSVVSALCPDFDPSESVRRATSEIVKKRVQRQFTMGGLYNALLDVNSLFHELPERLNKVSKLVADNELKLNIDAIDEDKLIEGLQKIANRISTALVLAALIVGASLMMRLETSLKVFGYPAIAVVFFLAAAGAGVFIVFRSLVNDIRRHE